jgi:hypothetical protein
MRGAGGCGGPATTCGVAGRGATGGACGAAEAEIGGAAGILTCVLTGSVGGAGRGGTSVGADATGGATGRSGAGGGTITRGGIACGTTGAAVTTGLTTGGAITGLETTGGAAATGTGLGGGAASASFFCVIARRTSPGREMFDKSILVLISSSPRSGRADLADDACRSAEPRIWARTFSASWSSIELECVFFSVTPTSDSVSKMALLLTSSSLARSLIRTLLIRPFCSPR